MYWTYKNEHWRYKVPAYDKEYIWCAAIHFLDIFPQATSTYNANHKQTLSYERAKYVTQSVFIQSTKDGKGRLDI